ncbi:MAG TPA: LamG domain-containing protein, partial [Chloroflexota bacterium]|nr:LamG domain-containing protein [Chloroflexota bacterium]
MFRLAHPQSATDPTTGRARLAGRAARERSRTHSPLPLLCLFIVVLALSLAPALTGSHAGIAHAAGACTPNAVPSTYAQAVLADSPLGYWRLDETCVGQVSDASGNGLNGTASGGITVNQPGAPLGDGDAAMAFDGSTGYVSLGDPAALQPSRLSVEAWINTTSAPNAVNTIVRKRYYGYNLSLNDAGQPSFTIDDQTATIYGVAAPQVVTDGRWHYLVGTYDGQQVCLYVDGSSAGCKAAPPIYYQPDAVAIGRDGGASDGYFSGRIDDVAIYGAALSATQVQAHFSAAHTPSSCTPSVTPSTEAQAVLASGPLGYWRLDETCKGIVADHSGHGLSGVAIGNLTPNQPGIPAGDGAMGFDSASGYISLGDPAALQPGTVTVEAWINTTHTGAQATIVRKRMYGYDLYLNADGTPAFYIYDSNATQYIAAGSASVANGQWHHLVGTYDGSQVCLYVDGTQATCAPAGTIYYGHDLVAIGRDGGASDAYFGGRIDDVAIYGRV